MVPQATVSLVRILKLTLAGSGFSLDMLCFILIWSWLFDIFPFCDGLFRQAVVINFDAHSYFDRASVLFSHDV